MSSKLISQIEPIFQQVFNNSEISLSRETTAQDVEGWDSLNHIRLIISLEMELGITFDSNEVAELTNVGDLMDYIESQINQ
jgi:acyl carrier protein